MKKTAGGFSLKHACCCCFCSSSCKRDLCSDSAGDKVEADTRCWTSIWTRDFISSLLNILIWHLLDPFSLESILNGSTNFKCQWITPHYLSHRALSSRGRGCGPYMPGQLWLSATLSCCCSQLHPLCQWAVTNTKTHLTSGLLDLLLLNRCCLGNAFTPSFLWGGATLGWAVSVEGARKASQVCTESRHK